MFDCFACGVQQHVETTTATADFIETNEPPNAEARVDAESTTHSGKDPADAEKNESTEVEKGKRKSFLPSISSRICSTARDITIDESRDDSTIGTERCDAPVVCQSISTEGGRNGVEVNYLSGLNSVVDDAGKTNESKGEGDGAESDALDVLAGLGGGRLEADVNISAEDGLAGSTRNEALATTKGKKTISPETRSGSKTNRSRLGKLRFMTAIVKKESLYTTAKKGAISEGEVLESNKSANDKQAEPTNEETFTAAEDDKIIIPETAADDEENIKPEGQSLANRSMLESLASTVKKGSLTATEKRGALINTMHAKMAKNQAEKKSPNDKQAEPTNEETFTAAEDEKNNITVTAADDEENIKPEGQLAANPHPNKLRSMSESLASTVKKGSLTATEKRGALDNIMHAKMVENQAEKKSPNDTQAEPTNEETFTALEDEKISFTVTAADHEENIKLEGQPAANPHPKKLRSMLESLASTVKKGSLTATEKKGALVNEMHAKMVKNQVVEKEETVAITKASFVDIMNAKVKKTRMAEGGRKPESERASEMKAVLVQSAWSYDYFQVVLSGNKSTDMMIRLPYKQNTTFQDLRRELEEDYAEDLPFSRFKFTVSKDGMAVSSMQEQKWTVRDYDLTNQGGDGSYKNPYLVYIRKDIGKEKDTRKTKASKTKKGTRAPLLDK